MLMDRLLFSMNLNQIILNKIRKKKRILTYYIIRCLIKSEKHQTNKINERAKCVCSSYYILFQQIVCRKTKIPYKKASTTYFYLYIEITIFLPYIDSSFIKKD